MKKVLLVVVLCGLSLTAHCEDEFDFVLMFKECVNTYVPLGWLKEGETKVIVEPSGEITMACKKTPFKDSYQCLTEMVGVSEKQPTQKGVIEYTVSAENEKLLLLRLDKGREDVLIHKEYNATNLVSGMLSERFNGAKVCHGAYFTATQYRELEKKTGV